MGATWVKIASVGPIASSQAYLEFATIPNTYTHLMVMTKLQGNNGGGGRDDLWPLFNSTTTTNYYSTRTITYDNTNTLVNSDANLGATIAYPNSGTGSIYGYVRILIPYYANSAYNKIQILSGGFATTSVSNMLQGLAVQRNTADNNAITSIKLDGNPNNIYTGSSAYLYGLSNT